MSNEQIRIQYVKMCDLAAQIATVVTQTSSSSSQSILDIYKNRELVRSPESMDQLRNMLVDIAKQVLIFYDKAQQEVRDL